MQSTFIVNEVDKHILSDRPLAIPIPTQVRLLPRPPNTWPGKKIEHILHACPDFHLIKEALRNKYADELLDKQWKKMRVRLWEYLLRPNMLVLAIGKQFVLSSCEGQKMNTFELEKE